MKKILLNMLFIVYILLSVFVLVVTIISPFLYGEPNLKFWHFIVLYLIAVLVCASHEAVLNILIKIEN